MGREMKKKSKKVEKNTMQFRIAMTKAMRELNEKNKLRMLTLESLFRKIQPH